MLDLADLKSALSGSGERLEDAEINEVFRILDIHGDGPISIDELTLRLTGGVEAKVKSINALLERARNAAGAPSDGSDLKNFTDARAEVVELRKMLLDLSMLQDEQASQKLSIDRTNFPKNYRKKGQSLSSKIMTPTFYLKFANVVGPRGYTFDMALQCGLDGRSGTGMAIPDEESYYLWKEWYDFIIEKCHGHAPNAKHITDLDSSKVNVSELNKISDLDNYCVSTRIRAARNISGYGLPPGTTRSERREVESLIAESLKGLKDELAGSYYSLVSMTAEESKQLSDDHFLFQKPDPNAMIFSCGGVRDWPEGRGIYHNKAKSFLVWVNEEDQMRVISMQKGGNVPEVFARWAKGVNEVEKCLADKGKKYMYDEHIGQFSSCVSNVGTGLRASMHILLPKIIEQIGQDGLEKLCWDKLEMQCRGTGGEHTAAVGGRVDISNQKRIGKTEVELVQIMVDGVVKLIGLEKSAEKGMDIKTLIEKM